MYPVTNGSYMIANSALRYLTFVVREQKIHTPTMNIKLLTQIFCAHRRAFDMPAGKTYSPWTCPSHNVFEGCIFPQSKISPVSFLFLPFQLSCGFKKIINHSSA